MNIEYQLTNGELKKSAFFSVNQRLRNDKPQKPETKNQKLFN